MVLTLLACLGLTSHLLVLPPALRELDQEPGAADFSGLWESSYGRMRLSQLDGQVTGSYSYASGSSISGSMDGARLTFRYAEPDAQGEGWFELREEGRSFEGRWRPAGSEVWQPWSGRRVTPETGKIYLVVLEAYWETSLAEEEYSFGAMLRSYFTMSAAQHVEVRHRFFHDAVDFRRLCAEVTYLAEPVVLLISSHGSESGIGVGGAVIDAETIAASTRNASNLKLLHLSGCSMMNGAVPAQVMERIPAAARFPISGYRTTVAWDASAISDFIFMSFLLIHRMEPAEALRQCGLVAPFIRDGGPEGSAFVGLGLDLLAPDALRPPQ